MLSATESVRIIVRGRVQGVGFRYFTKQRADAYNLIGFVQNLTDGNVEVVAKGPQKSLDNLIEDLKSGPPGSAVSDCVVNWRPAIYQVQGFTIKSNYG